MGVVTRGASVISKMFGVGLGKYLVHPGVTLILMTVTALLFRRALTVADDHRVVRASMTGHADLWLNTLKVIRSAALFAVAAQATRNESVACVAFCTSKVGMLAGEVCQFFRRTTVAV